MPQYTFMHIVFLLYSGIIARSLMNKVHNVARIREKEIKPAICWFSFLLS